MPELYPILLDLQEKKCVVVGGGKVAERKIAALLAAAAEVVVVSPVVTAGIERMRLAGNLRVLLREYGEDVLRGASLAFACTDSDDVNARVCADARKQGVFANNVSQPEKGDMRNMACLRRGKLQICVATGGASPLLARQLIRRLADEFGPEYATYVEFLEELRSKVQIANFSADKRRRILASALQWGILEQIGNDTFMANRDSILRELLEARHEDDLRGNPAERACRHADGTSD
ncbi:MAG TPA: NAD(P)-dependent oxidoreductase [Bacilli bacterium]